MSPLWRIASILTTLLDAFAVTWPATMVLQLVTCNPMHAVDTFRLDISEVMKNIDVIALVGTTKKQHDPELAVECLQLAHHTAWQFGWRHSKHVNTC